MLLFRFGTVYLCIGMLLAGCSAPQPAITPTTFPVGGQFQMNSPEYGVQAFLWWRPETADRDLELAKEAGFTWVKQTFAWRDIEGAAKGALDWSRADIAVNLANTKGIDLLARVDNAPDWAAPGCYNAERKTMGPALNTQDWIDFLSAFAARYKGRIRAYEIWNEPNLAREWCSRRPNAAEYAALLKVSYQTIKAVDPNAMIVSAGLTLTTQQNSEAMPDTVFLDQMYAAMKGDSSGYFDVLGVHAPGFKAPPETSPEQVARNSEYNHGEGAAGRIYGFRHVEDIRRMMVACGDAAKQIAILEMGWTSDPLHAAYAWIRVDEQTKAEYNVRAFQYAKQNWAPWIGAMFLIYLANPDWQKSDEEYWWAITEPDGTPRPAYLMIKEMVK
ncbi:MAG: cellulase family glycosylhydrolase [Chloroflexi bacterium]|nr:cellulase family glycosylhydrolase [Chloroflexota bacterium]